MEDITADASSADSFAPQVQIAPPTPAPAKPVATIAACTLASRHACDGNLTACLIEDPTSHPSVCACFFSYGACFRSAACYDMLPRSHIAYCFETVQCDMMDCLGSRINAALAASLASGAGVAALALLLALWARA
ncbi:MAG: hypothetical protein EOO41_05000 [Methanobacteriota archaeon]|nr:MAG: hypothetical protein EOO41_05000 [Euryarchaeota archaeon]